MNDSITEYYSTVGNHALFSGNYRDAIFSNKMVKYFNGGDHSGYDDVQDYTLNSSGYRGPEFIKNVDLLVAGCSFTYGMGVPENGIWGSIIADKLGVTYNNISQNAASIPWIVRQLFAYFHEYGNPKTLLCLFPTLTRTFFPSNAEILISDDGYLEESTKNLSGDKSIYNTELSHILPSSQRPKYSKRPHNLEDVVSLDFIIQIAISNIRMLEQYCRSSNIEFYWGTWSDAFSSTMEEPGNLLKLYEFDNYVSMDYPLWKAKPDQMAADVFYKNMQDKKSCMLNHNNANCDCHVSCHQEYLDKYPDSFYRGTDVLDKHPHFGVHRHIHFAEAFMKAMNK